MENRDILVVGVAGGSGSGKTTLTKNLLERFGGDICVVHHDDYYRAHDDMTYEQRTHINYDEPAAYETDLLCRDLSLLRQGQSVRCPVYDFTLHNRSGETRELCPRPILLVEGILIFADDALCGQLDLRIFVDTDADLRLARRMVRDTEERGRSVRSVKEQWEATVKPMHEKYVEPSKRKAHIIVPEGGERPMALELIAAYLQQHLLHAGA